MEGERGCRKQCGWNQGYCGSGSGESEERVGEGKRTRFNRGGSKVASIIVGGYIRALTSNFVSGAEARIGRQVRVVWEGSGPEDL